MTLDLNEEQENQAIQWLKNKWRVWFGCKNRCEICMHSSWVVGKVIVTTIPIDIKKRCIVLDEKITPQFTIMCENCGNTKYLNAVVAGIIERDEEYEETNRNKMGWAPPPPPPTPPPDRPKSI